MNIYADQLNVQAEIDRRLELRGVDPQHRHDDAWHRHRRPPVPSRPHPLASFVARLVGGRQTAARGGVTTGAPVAPGAPATRDTSSRPVR